MTLSPYPTSMVWGRIGPDEHVRRIQGVLYDEFEEMGIPSGLAASLAARAAAIFGGWEPFRYTWYFQYEQASDE